MKKKKIFGFLGLAFLSLVSCDKDFNTVGADLVDESNYEFNKYPVEHLNAFTRATGSVQSNNLSINALGVFNDPVFGTTKAHFVTQLTLADTDPDYGVEIEMQTIDSVYLYVPYFSSVDDTDEDGNSTFTLDSIHGNLDETFDLKIFESNYYLRDYEVSDPTSSQKYYSDQKDLIENNLIGSQLNNSSNISENTMFKFSADEIRIYETDDNGNFLDSDGAITTDLDARVVKERLDPGMWINLDKTAIFNKIFQANPSDLFNNNNFKNYFRGLYFQVSQNSGGALAKIDFSGGYIMVQYHSKDDADSDLEKKFMKINLSDNTINFLENDPSTATDGSYQSAISSGSYTENDELLYLKGGVGSVAYIDLFGGDVDNDQNGISDELDYLRDENWLINDAVLTFTVANKNNELNSSDQQGVALGQEPTRIYLFNAKTNEVLIDYTYDSTTASDSKYNKYLYGGLLEVDDNEEGTRYKFRLLYYVKNLISTEDLEDLKNIRLGLVVTESISNITHYQLKNPITNLPVTLPLSGSASSIDQIPLSSIINPLGTVLYGNHANIDADKRMKFEIYYTKPN